MSNPSELDLKQLSEKLNMQNERDIKSGLMTPDFIYLDLSLCKDFTLGYVYWQLMKKTDPQYQQQRYEDIFKEISKWQFRTFDDFEEYYPAYGIANEEIAAALNNPVYADAIFQHSPNTNFFNTIRMDLAINANHSAVAEKFTKRTVGDGRYIRESTPITLFINTFPLKLSPGMNNSVGTFFNETFGVDVVIVTVDPSQLDYTPSWLLKSEVLYIASIESWFYSDYIKNQFDQSVQFFLQEGTDVLNRVSDNNALFFHKKIFGRRLYSIEAQSRMKKSGQDFDYQFNLITSQLNIMTTFEWIPNRLISLIPVEDDTPEPADESLDKLLQLGKRV